MSAFLERKKSNPPVRHLAFSSRGFAHPPSPGARGPEERKVGSDGSRRDVQDGKGGEALSNFSAGATGVGYDNAGQPGIMPVAGFMLDSFLEG